MKSSKARNPSYELPSARSRGHRQPTPNTKTRDPEGSRVVEQTGID
jgi:hypothetical protein